MLPRRGVIAMLIVLREKEVARYWMLMKLELEMKKSCFAEHVNVFELSVQQLLGQLWQLLG